MRRDFLWKLGFGSIMTALGGASVLSFQFLTPNVLFEPPTRFKAGKPEDYAAGSVTLLAKQSVYVVRAEKGFFYALSAVCTHLGCITNYRSADEKIACPCHGSLFDLTGEVLDGPAPKALSRVLIELNDHGDLIVDTGAEISEDYTLKV